MLKKYAALILIILMLTSGLQFGCSTNHYMVSSSPKPEFKNEGERATQEIQELFKRDYKRENYDKYDGALIKDGLTYKYGEMIIKVGDDPVLISVLDNRLIYPSVMGIFHVQLTKENRNTPFAHSDTVRISDFHEIKFVELSPKQRRFQFWLFNSTMFNPTEYYLELTNQNATIKTDLLSFIKGSKLTYFKNGGIII